MYSEPILHIEQLCCQYRSANKQQTQVLDELSLSVNAGEIVCLLGASGCGKTTLLKAIAGLLPINHGRIRLKGQDLNLSSPHQPALHLAPEKRHIGMIFQDYALFPHLTVAQNIAFGLQKQSKAEQEQQIKRMLELVQLDGYGARYPHQLSGGQQQRVAIARSLAYQPDLLLLDEPFSNIDTQVRHALIREIRQLFKAQGITAIFVSHSREEAFAFADKMAVMNQGRIEQFGSASELYYQPQSKFVADFLGGGNYLQASINAHNMLETCLGEFRYQTATPLYQTHTLSRIQSLQALIRPQQLQLIADPQGEGKITELQFMGDHCRYLVSYQGKQLIGCASMPLSEGMQVQLQVSDEELPVFAASS